MEDPSAAAHIFHSFRKHTLMSQNQDGWKFSIALHICSFILKLDSWQSYTLRVFETETTIALSDQICKCPALSDRSITAPFVSLGVYALEN